MWVAALLVQPDGKVVVAGTDSDESAFVLRRFLPDGAPDSGFGTGGRVVTPLRGGFDGYEVAAVQPDGRIVVGGLAGGETPAFAIARYEPDGAPDPAFGTGGTALGALGANPCRG